MDVGYGNAGFGNLSLSNRIQASLSIAGVYQLVVSSGGVAVGNSPTFTVLPNITSQLVFANRLVSFVAGVPQSAYVQTTDDFGNNATTTSDNFTMSYTVTAYTPYTSPVRFLLILEKGSRSPDCCCR